MRATAFGPFLIACCVLAPLALILVLSLTAQNFADANSGPLVAFVPSGESDGWVPSTDSAESTPKDQWQKGTVPYLYQIDPQWSSAPYAGSTVGEAGCGPTCMVMAYVALTGSRDYDPPKMAQFAEAEGFVEDGLTTWLFMTEGAKKLGLRSTELPADTSRVASAISQGHPVILTLGPGDFTTTGHFVVVAGIDEDGNWIIRDPNSPERSMKTWDPERVLPQCRNLWEIAR